MVAICRQIFECDFSFFFFIAFSSVFIILKSSILKASVIISISIRFTNIQNCLYPLFESYKKKGFVAKFKVETNELRPRKWESDVVRSDVESFNDCCQVDEIFSFFLVLCGDVESFNDCCQVDEIFSFFFCSTLL